LKDCKCLRLSVEDVESAETDTNEDESEHEEGVLEQNLAVVG